MKVLIYSARPYDKDALVKANEDKHQLDFTDKKLSLETAHLASGYAAVSLFTSDDASKSVLEKLHALGVKYIALRCVGYDHVDLAKAKELNIKVANVPEYSPYSVAEHAVALLLAVNRKIIRSQQLMDQRDYRLDTLVGFDIHEKKVGVIGTGKIGLAFCRIMKGFGAEVIAADPIQNEEAIALGINYVSLPELLAESDIVSLHCPLNKETKYLLSEANLSLMKDTATLINTSRGGLIKTSDLISALAAGKFRGVGLDVYENEKGLFFNDHRQSQTEDELLKKLRGFPNVLITGHQGFLTDEALQGISATTLQNLQCWQSNIESPNTLTSK